MKTKDQQQLEEAYNKVLFEFLELKDKNGKDIRIGDKLRYDDDKENVFILVGFRDKKIQLEKVQNVPKGTSPHWIRVLPSKVTKID